MGRGWEPIARHIISENKFTWGALSVDFNVLHIMPFLIWPQLTFHDSSLVTFPHNSLHTHTHTHRHSTPGRPASLQKKTFFNSIIQASQSFHKDVSDTLVSAGDTEMSKTWLDHLVEEIKSNSRSIWSSVFNRNTVKRYVVHRCHRPYSQNIVQLLCVCVSQQTVSLQLSVFLSRLWATSGPVSCLHPGVHTCNSASGLYIFIICTNES